MTTMSSARERASRAIRSAAADALLDDHAIDQDLDRVVLALVEQDVLVERPELAVDPGPRKSSSSQGGKVLLELALRPRTTGAMTLMRSSAGTWRTTSTMRSRDCDDLVVAHRTVGTPIFANSNRR